MHNTIISIDSEIVSGAPVFKGTRVLVRTLFDYLEHGHSIEEFIEHFPSVKEEQAKELLKIAGDTFNSQNILSLIDENTN
jgi:uncharacterized protein (DUF433 family)